MNPVQGQGFLHKQNNTLVNGGGMGIGMPIISPPSSILSACKFGSIFESYNSRTFEYDVLRKSLRVINGAVIAFRVR